MSVYSVLPQFFGKIKTRLRGLEIFPSEFGYTDGLTLGPRKPLVKSRSRMKG